MRRTAFLLSCVIVGMVGLAYASVPLYQLFCQVTGYGGTIQRAEASQKGVTSDRVIRIRFDANTEKSLQSAGWKFSAVQTVMDVRVGEEHLAFYHAQNMQNNEMIGTATFNVTPHKAGPYFNKIACFCFTEQTLHPGQSVDMPVSFFVDPDIMQDASLDDVTEITLSYTFFPSEGSPDG
ncbi:MAG: cytochrome c oxidase assembly protein [Alphaproteobacteria bacterium]|nr:cytochrome c oxidase assembly protein [Alphaproteobacteria bacterium]